MLHWATHRIPGVPAHVEQPAGHQGRTHHHRGRNHSPARPPRVMVGWQRRIAAFFGQEPR
jgi:hypothetical protein